MMRTTGPLQLLQASSLPKKLSDSPRPSLFLALRRRSRAATSRFLRTSLSMDRTISFVDTCISRRFTGRNHRIERPLQSRPLTFLVHHFDYRLHSRRLQTLTVIRHASSTLRQNMYAQHAFCSYLYSFFIDISLRYPHWPCLPGFGTATPRSNRSLHFSHWLSLYLGGLAIGEERWRKYWRHVWEVKHLFGL